MTAPPRSRKGRYGFDAPAVPLMFAAAATLFAVLAAISWHRHAARGATATPLAVAACFVLQTASFIYTTRRGKFLAWDEVLGRMAWQGDERVLDLGCGRGAVLTQVAKRLATGTATGVDIWSSTDQSGNSLQACRQNVVREGVGGRVELTTGDMQALPFDTESFDVVVSSLAIHNISTASGRALAIAHAVRVLTPGGRLVIADIRRTTDYASELRRLGMLEVTTRGLGWRFWYGNPFVSASLVTAMKPQISK